MTGCSEYNPLMLTITTLQPDQAAEARRVIYTTAHALFQDFPSLEETISYYEQSWPLRDVLDFQRSYVDKCGTFLVVRDGDRIVGTGALRWLELDSGETIQTIAEIKRVWLLPEYQGRGLGYQMMMQLIAFACEKGYVKVRLETSPQYQPRAFAFYQRLGFSVIPRYGDDPDDVGMEMDLS